MKPVILLAALLACPVRAEEFDEAEARGIRDPQFREATFRLHAAYQEAERRSGELAGLVDAYSQDSDPNRFADRRGPARAAMGTALGDLDKVRREYLMLGQVLSAARALTAIKPRGGTDPPVPGDIYMYTRFRDYGSQTERQMHRWQAQLASEEASFAALKRRLREERERRARNKALAAVGGAGAVAALGFLALRAFRPRRPPPPPGVVEIRLGDS